MVELTISAEGATPTVGKERVLQLNGLIWCDGINHPVHREVGTALAANDRVDVKEIASLSKVEGIDDSGRAESLVEEVLGDVELEEACAGVVDRNVKRRCSRLVRERQHTPCIACLSLDEWLDVSAVDALAMFVDRDVRELDLDVEVFGVDSTSRSLITKLVGEPPIVRGRVSHVGVEPVRRIVPERSHRGVGAGFSVEADSVSLRAVPISLDTGQVRCERLGEASCRPDGSNVEGLHICVYELIK